MENHVADSSALFVAFQSVVRLREREAPGLFAFLHGLYIWSFHGGCDRPDQNGIPESHSIRLTGIRGTPPSGT
jgi:hypothetical protein